MSVQHGLPDLHGRLSINGGGVGDSQLRLVGSVPQIEDDDAAADDKQSQQENKVYERREKEKDNDDTDGKGPSRETIKHLRS